MSASSSNERKRLRSLDNVASAAFPPSKRSPQGPLSEHQTTFPDPQVMKTMKILGTHAVNDPVCLPTVIEFLRAHLPEGDPVKNYLGDAESRESFAKKNIGPVLEAVTNALAEEDGEVWKIVYDAGAWLEISEQSLRVSIRPWLRMATCKVREAIHMPDSAELPEPEPKPSHEDRLQEQRIRTSDSIQITMVDLTRYLAVEKSWNGEFKGTLDSIILRCLEDYAVQERHCSDLLYSHSVAIVNASGTGKSRAVDQVGLTVPLVPLNLAADVAAC